MELKKRLSDLLLALELKQYQFAKSIGVSPGNVSDWLKIDNKNPGVDALIRICEVHHVNLNWLLTGSGKMFETPNHLMSAIEDQAQTIVDLKRSESVRIPVVGCIAAGPPLEIFDVDPLDYITLDKTLIRYPNEYVAFQVEGDSMYPEIRNGDVVLIHRKYDYGYLHETIVAVQINGENTLKTIHVDDLHRQSILYPINSRKHKAIILNEDTSDNVTILGQLVMLFRKYL